MSYKFLRVTKIYPQFLQNLYRNNTQLKNLKYSMQFDVIMKNFFGTSDSWEYHLEQLGYETNQIVFNAQSLQETWANEHNIQEDGLELLYTQIKYYKPEVLFIQVASIVTDDFIRLLRKNIKELKLIVIHKCAPTSTKELKVLHSSDMTLTCIEGMLDYFKQQYISTELIRHAFDDRVLNYITPTTPKNELAFAGSIIVGDGFHLKRQKTILALLEEGLPFKMYGKINNKYTYQNYLLEKEHFGLDYYNSLLQSSICFNNHIDIAGNYAGNMRLFESTGIGTCLLTDDKSNIGKMFLNEKEVLTYKDQNDAIEKAKFLLDNPLKAKEIAMNGQKRTLKEHTFKNRALQFHDLIKKKFQS